MRQLRVLTAFFTLALVARAESPVTADEVIARHLAARGGEERMRAITTLVHRDGTYHEGDYTSDGGAFMAFRAPYYRVVGNPDDPRASFSEGYDGSAWEWYGDIGVVIRTVGPAARATRHGTSFMGPFLDYRDKGTSVALGGLTLIAGHPAYDLIVTLRDGFQRHYYVDESSWLVAAERYIAPQHAFGEDVKTESRFDDYRAVNGVLFSFHNEEVDLATGKTLNEMTWGAIEANRELPLSWFSPRSFERTPLQRILELLYEERTDAEAVMWSYFDFRRVHPGVDTSRGIELIGYQMLKMGDESAAVALLEANARDYPQSASAAFSLGRAYEASGNRAAARAEFERALRIDPKHARAARALKGMG